MLPLRAGALSSLRRKGVTNISDLTRLSKQEFEGLTGLGRKSIVLIQNEMKRHGVTFRESEQEA